MRSAACSRTRLTTQAVAGIGRRPVRLRGRAAAGRRAASDRPGVTGRTGKTKHLNGLGDRHRRWSRPRPRTATRGARVAFGTSALGGAYEATTCDVAPRGGDGRAAAPWRRDGRERAGSATVHVDRTCGPRDSARHARTLGLDALE